MVVVHVHFALSEVVAAEVAAALLFMPHSRPVLDDERTVPDLDLITTLASGGSRRILLPSQALSSQNLFAVPLIPLSLCTRG